MMSCSRCWYSTGPMWVWYNTSSTLHDATLYDGDLDLTQNVKGCNVTTVREKGTGVFRDPNNAAAVGTIVEHYGKGDWGSGRKFTSAAI